MNFFLLVKYYLRHLKIHVEKSTQIIISWYDLMIKKKKWTKRHDSHGFEVHFSPPPSISTIQIKTTKVLTQGALCEGTQGDTE